MSSFGSDEQSINLNLAGPLGYYEDHMTTKPSRSRKQVLAADVWRLIAEFAFSNFQRSTQASLMRELGLTPGHLKALAILDPDEPRPMRAMADALSCDASMVTWLVDRLED